MNKLNIGVVFGGASPEHDVSCASALNIFNYLDLDKYNIIPIYVSREGCWFLYDGNLSKLPANIEKYSAGVTLSRQGILRIVGEKVKNITIDVAFSVIHGRTGEDGAIQGFFEMCGLPYVGCGVSASAICMDKTRANSVVESLGIPTIPYITIFENDSDDSVEKKVAEVRSKLGYPCFVKPASGGSSIGTSKAKNKKEIIAAVEHALKFDYKVIIQKFIKCRELECSVIGSGDEIEVSLPGEIVTPEEFYSYDAKYNNPVSKNIIPAPVDKKIADTAMEYSFEIFKSIECSGLARIDFFLEQKTDKLFFNEINTMPGFTNISMYPQSIVHMGYSPQSMLDRLINIAVYKP
ncbi:MAG: D-alanine--D-alanine ligase [Defluviitaleaceae bacterium]|nr:D-alanine--D-alanine ligase [Defluviitaleaceae bacterium]